MVGLSITGHVNGLIMNDPEAAIVVASGLVAAGTAVTLRKVLRAMGRDYGFSRAENREIDLLDEQAPEGFWHQAATGVYGGLVAAKMTEGTIKPRLRWLCGLWTVDHGINVGSELEPVTLVDLTTVNTPMLKGNDLA